MADDFRVKGAEDFLRLSKALKAAGQKELRKELNKNLREAVKPLIPQTRAAARSILPQRGGLAALVAKAPQRAQVRTGNEPGIRLVVGKRRGSAAASANRGVIRHPVFGRRDNFVEQHVTPGWFDDTLEKAGPEEARRRIEQALTDIADKVVRQARGGGL